MHSFGIQEMSFNITQDCVGCSACKRKCPWNAIVGEKKQKHLIDPTLCQECATCWYTCPKCAVEDIHGCRREKGERPRIPKATIDRKSCLGCQNCRFNCEQGAIHYEKLFLSGFCVVEESLCLGCGSCLNYCVSDSISLT